MKTKSLNKIVLDHIKQNGSVRCSVLSHCADWPLCFHTFAGERIVCYRGRTGTMTLTNGCLSLTLDGGKHQCPINYTIEGSLLCRHFYFSAINHLTTNGD